MNLSTSNSVLARFKTWIVTRPKFDTLYDTRIAKVLDLFLLSFIAITLITSTLAFGLFSWIDLSKYYAEDAQQRVTGCTFIGLFALGIRIVLLKGYLQTTVRILSLFFIFITTLTLYVNGQTSDVIILLYAVGLVLSTSVLSWQETTLYSVLCFFSLIGLTLLKNMSLLPTSETPSSFSRLIIGFLVFAILQCFLRFQTSTINRSTLKDTLTALELQLEERDKLYHQLNHNALYDSLTNLPNRRLLDKHLRTELQQVTQNPESTFAVLLFDIDRFKIINDTLGHAVGDQVLIIFAKKLQSAIRATDFVARLGGDEFIALLNGSNNQQEAILIAQRVIDDLKTPIHVNGKVLTLSCSVGIAYSDTQHTTTSDVLRDADIAMYQSKHRGEGNFSIFDEVISKQIQANLILEKDLPQAIINNEILIHFQPIFNLGTMRLSGFEILTRWQHPIRGLISPDIYIPIAEESGLIVALDSHILERACQQFLVWKASGLLAEDIYLSANLSPKCFAQVDCAKDIIRLLTKLNFNPSYIVFEITEGSLMTNIDDAIMNLNALKAVGIEISIDDFGTGYSSLSYLHSLPIDTVKIDRSFVMHMHEGIKNKHIVETIITLTKSLNMKVVAEGVEDLEQLGHLRSLACDYGQGYYFSKPLSIEDTEVFLQSAHTNNYFVDNMIVDVIDRVKN